MLVDIVTDNDGCGLDFNQRFDTICQTVVSLMNNRAPIDIKIIFLQINDKSTFDKYCKVFLQYFDEEKLLNDYKPPICNNYCVSMIHPRMSFTFVDSNNCPDSQKTDDHDDDSDDFDGYNDYACFHVKNADNG